MMKIEVTAESVWSILCMIAGVILITVILYRAAAQEPQPAHSLGATFSSANLTSRSTLR